MMAKDKEQEQVYSEFLTREPDDNVMIALSDDLIVSIAEIKKRFDSDSVVIPRELMDWAEEARATLKRMTFSRECGYDSQNLLDGLESILPKKEG